MDAMSGLVVVRELSAPPGSDDRLDRLPVAL